MKNERKQYHLGVRDFASCSFFRGGRKFCDGFSGIFCRDRLSPFATQCRGGLYFRTSWRAGDGKRDYGGVHVRIDPLCFSVFFSLIGQFGLDGIHRFAVFAIIVWSFFLDILAIRANYGFGKGKAFFISISPFLLCGMLITALFVIGIMTALAGISELQDVEGIINSF